MPSKVLCKVQKSVYFADVLTPATIRRSVSLRNRLQCALNARPSDGIYLGAIKENGAHKYQRACKLGDREMFLLHTVQPVDEESQTKNTMERS